ncbi:phosphoglycerate mutase protein [Halorhabdus tiamatea SARL4B]|uniref:Arabinan endo-alpha-1,5-L-arabinosidase, family GH43 n=1 Tax=Halorhabdus tiamatea SARL4B TaxID=1033806 RepID=F7PJI1_9EURY|nr:family 43 glycosylhydrolase [Halorhabdus tiamatea]ERJ05802.1 phosphoglycerate mutase protein [Halorhabdus tiamatea SARL4B]CCQ34263.1 arabinan endo-alpha-1,5-L-arabinosidase, family GH43 [Halorhabdus tiamatea SARL4B]
MTAGDDTHTLNRRHVLKSIGAGAVGTTSVLSARSVIADSDGTHYSNPLYGPDFADPTIHRADDGTWWAYASNMSYIDDADEELVPILSSPDLVNWTYEGEAFDSRPGWLYGSIWAPDVHYHDGQWVLFYALWPRGDDDSQVPGIGVATADTPDGPFTDHGEILSNPDHPYPGNTIDPYFVFHNETPYLFWANFAGINVVELTDDLRDYRAGTFDQIAGSAYEGPAIFKRGDYWYVFGSTGDCCDGFDSTYEVEVGRSEYFLGPYHDRNGTPMLERDEWNAGPTHLGDNDRFVGPGHGDVTVDDDGTYWFVYHAYDTEGPAFVDSGWPPARQLFVDPIRWEDGWPIIGCDGTPSIEMPIPGEGGYCSGSDDGTGDGGGDGTDDRYETWSDTDDPYYSTLVSDLEGYNLASAGQFVNGNEEATVWDTYEIDGGNADRLERSSLAVSDEVPFSEAARFEVTDTPENPWEITLKSVGERELESGHVLLGVAYMRTPDEEASVTYKSTASSNESDNYVTRAQPPLDTEWQRYYFPIEFGVSAAPGEWWTEIWLGAAAQTVDIGGLAVIDFARGVRADDLPVGEDPGETAVETDDGTETVTSGESEGEQDDDETSDSEGTPADALPGGEGSSQDLDGDGLYEDVDGDGDADISDVRSLLTNFNSEMVQEHADAYDFDGDGGVDVGDVLALYRRSYRSVT